MIDLFSQGPGPTVSTADVTIWHCDECDAVWHDAYIERVYDPNATQVAEHWHAQRPVHHAPWCSQREIEPI